MATVQERLDKLMGRTAKQTEPAELTVQQRLDKLMGRTATTPYQRQTAPVARDWGRIAAGSNPVNRLVKDAGLDREELELRTTVQAGTRDLDTLKAREQEAKGRLGMAEQGYNRPAGLMDAITGETQRRMDAYQAAAEEYEAAKSARTATETRVQEAERTLTARQYEKLRSAPDFGEKSQYVERKTEREMDYLATFVSYLGDELAPAVWKSSEWEDPFYAAVNGDEGARAYLRNQDNTYGAEGGALGHFIDSATGGNQELREIEGDEVALYNYIYATQGADAAAEYYAYLQSDLYRRHREAEEQQARMMAKEDPVGSSVGTVAMSPLRGLSYVMQIGDYLGTGKINENAPYNRFSYIPSAVRDQVSKDIEKNVEGFWGKAGSFAYQTGMSMGDFLFNTGITGGNQALTLAIMGTGAAADATIEAKDRGLSDNQAFALGAIAGVAEVITERISLEALLKPDWEKGALRYILKNALAEGSEEVGSGIINGVADVLISRDKSQWQQSVQAYIDAGHKDGEALGLAVRDAALEMGLDFLGGALSGGVMSGGAAAINVAGDYGTGRELKRDGLDSEGVRSLIETGQMAPADAQANRLAQEAQTKVEKGGELSAYEVGRLYNANVRAEQNGLLELQEEPEQEIQTSGKVAGQTAPEQQKTAPEGAVKADREAYTVISKLQENIPALGQNQAVAQVSTSAVNMAEGTTIAQKAHSLFAAIKGIVTRKGFGEVEITNRSAKDDLGHGIGAAKAAVIPAIPSIIQNGVQIDFQENWKGRGYDGYIFAAPVTMDGQTVYVAAVVKQTSKNRFYLHEVVDSNGNIIKIDSGDGATLTSLAADGDAGTPSPLSSDTTIPQGVEGVKGKDVQEGGVVSLPVFDSTERVQDKTARQVEYMPGSGLGEIQTSDVKDGQDVQEGGDDPAGSDRFTEDDWESLMAEPPLTEREQSISNALADFISETMTPEENAENIGRRQIRSKLLPLPEDTLKETITKEWRTFRRKLIDAGDSVAKLGKEIGDKELYAYYNAAGAAANAADNALRRGGEQTDVLGRRVGPSLADIWEPIRERGDGYYNEFQLYLFHRHNVDRMTRDNRVAIDMAEKAMAEFQDFSDEYKQYALMPESDLVAEAARGNEEAKAYLELLNEYNRAKAVYNKPVFGDEVTAKDSADAADALLRAHPEFQELAESVYLYNENLMQYRVDSGLLTKEQAERIESTYPHYVPTYRVQEKESGGGKRAKGKRVSSTVGVATGGNAALKPLHIAMAEQTERTIKEAARNRLGQRLIEDAGKREHKEQVEKYIYKIEDAMDGVNEDTFDLMDGSMPTMENTFTVRKNGRAYTMTVSQDLYEGIAALFPERKERGKIYRAARTANSLFKGLTTGYNPVFAGKNFIRDLQEAGLYSRDIRAWAKNYPLAVKEIATGGEWWRRYQALGGVYSSIFDYREGYKADGKKGAVQKLGEKVEALNMAVEQAPRLAEFMAVAKAGDAESMDTLMDAMYAAADVTTNFGRSGTWGKTINQTLVPFFNPAIQGLDKMGRRFLSGKTGKEWIKLLIRCAMLGFVPAILNELLCKDAPGWEDMRQSDKDVNWLIHIGDGKYIKLPKGRDISVVNMAAARVVDAIRGKEVDLWETLRTAGNQLAPPDPLTNNIFAAAGDTAIFDPDNPGRTWYGGDIESQRLRKYAPGQRYDEDTDLISKAIGGVLNFSPKKLNYLLDQYTGVVGDFVLPLLTPSGEKNLLAPFKKAFTVDTVTSNKVSGEFYDTGDRIDYAKNGGDGAMALVGRYWSKQESMVSDVYKRIRELELSDLPDKEKQEKIRLAKGMLTEVQKRAMEQLEAVEQAAREYYAGDEREKLDLAYREMNREVFGAEYALEVYNADVYEKAVGLNKDSGVSYDAFYDAYFAQKGITGDKGADGKTINLSASKKKKAAIDKATPGLSEKKRQALYEALGVSEKVWEDSTQAGTQKPGTTATVQERLDKLMGRTTSKPTVQERLDKLMGR